MRRVLMFLALAFLIGSVASPYSHAQSISDTTAPFRKAGFVLGFDGGLMQTKNAMGDALGSHHGQFQFRGALQWNSGFAVGAHLAGSELQKRTETAHLRSGLDVGLETTTSFTRIGLFGQYGPWLRGVRPYAEGLLGLIVVDTKTEVAGDDDSGQEDSSEEHKSSLAPAIGVAIGIEVNLATIVGYSVGLRIEGRHTRGGRVEYLAYRESEGTFVSRSSETTTSTVSIGLTMGRW